MRLSTVVWTLMRPPISASTLTPLRWTALSSVNTFSTTAGASVFILARAARRTGVPCARRAISAGSDPLRAMRPRMSLRRRRGRSMFPGEGAYSRGDFVMPASSAALSASVGP